MTGACTEKGGPVAEAACVCMSPENNHRRHINYDAPSLHKPMKTAELQWSHVQAVQGLPLNKLPQLRSRVKAADQGAMKARQSHSKWVNTRTHPYSVYTYHRITPQTSWGLLRFIHKDDSHSMLPAGPRGQGQGRPWLLCASILRNEWISCLAYA